MVAPNPADWLLRLRNRRRQRRKGFVPERGIGDAGHTSCWEVAESGHMWGAPQSLSDSVRIARASNPRGTTAMWVRDRLDGLWRDEDFTCWYPRDGRPGLSPAPHPVRPIGCTTPRTW